MVKLLQNKLKKIVMGNIRNLIGLSFLIAPEPSLKAISKIMDDQRDLSCEKASILREIKPIRESRLNGKLAPEDSPHQSSQT